MRGVRLLASLAILASTWLAPEAAAADQETALLTGVVTAADGARLPGVSLQMRHLDSDLVVRSVSTDAGGFRIGRLPAGRYRLTADLDGFDPWQGGEILLSAGQTLSVAVRLDVATVREQVRVVGLAPRDTVEAFEIRESFARDVGEALATLPGVVSLRKGAIANDIVVRGLQGKDVTVLIDGQRIDGACPGHMDPPVFHVDFAEVGRVEVSKGPFDVKNQGGLGGTVNVVTERAARGWHGTGSLRVSSAATLAASASASGGGGGWAVLGGASSRGADLYTDGAGRPFTAGANYRSDALADLRAYDVWTAWGRVALVPAAGTTIHVSYSRQSADDIVYPYLQMDTVWDNANRAGVRFEMASLPGGWQSLAAHAYYTDVNHWMTDEYRATSLNMARPYSMATRARTGIAGLRTEVQRGSVTLGVEATRREWRATTLLAMRGYAEQDSMPDVRIDLAGAFAAYGRNVRAGWRLDAGARIDGASSRAKASSAATTLYRAYYGTAATGADDVLPAGHVRASWRHEQGWAAAFGVGHAERVPDQQERYYALRRMGADWVGNPELRPSRNTGADAEVRFTGRGIDASVAAFVYRIDDSILVADKLREAALPGVMNTMARSYANVDALVRGLEASATVPLGPTLFLSADGSLVRGTTRGTTAADRHLPEMPPARARVRLRFDDARRYGAVEVVAAAGQGDVAAALRETPSPGFAVVNLRGGVRWRGLDVTVGVDNLLDALYAEHLSYQRDPFRNGVRVYEPGRTVSVSVGARF